MALETVFRRLCASGVTAPEIVIDPKFALATAGKNPSPDSFDTLRYHELIDEISGVSIQDDFMLPYKVAIIAQELDDYLKSHPEPDAEHLSDVRALATTFAAYAEGGFGLITRCVP